VYNLPYILDERGVLHPEIRSQMVSALGCESGHCLILLKQVIDMLALDAITCRATLLRDFGERTLQNIMRGRAPGRRALERSALEGPVKAVWSKPRWGSELRTGQEGGDALSPRKVAGVRAVGAPEVEESFPRVNTESFPGSLEESYRTKVVSTPESYTLPAGEATLDLSCSSEESTRMGQESFLGKLSKFSLHLPTYMFYVYVLKDFKNIKHENIPKKVESFPARLLLEEPCGVQVQMQVGVGQRALPTAPSGQGTVFRRPGVALECDASLEDKAPPVDEAPLEVSPDSKSHSGSGVRRRGRLKIDGVLRSALEAAALEAGVDFKTVLDSVCAFDNSPQWVLEQLAVMAFNRSLGQGARVPTGLYKCVMKRSVILEKRGSETSWCAAPPQRVRQTEAALERVSGEGAGLECMSGGDLRVGEGLSLLLSAEQVIEWDDDQWRVEPGPGKLLRLVCLGDARVFHLMTRSQLQALSTRSAGTVREAGARAAPAAPLSDLMVRTEGKARSFLEGFLARASKAARPALA